MSTAELIARLADALAWPIAAIVAAVLLRKPIATLIARHPPSRVKAGPFEVEWDRLLAETEKELDARVPTAAPPESVRPSVAEELEWDVQQVPMIAVREAYATVERELRDIVGSEEGVDTSRMGAVSLARLAERLGHITPDAVRAVEGLSVMRNLAVHGGESRLTSEQAQEYVALAAAAQYALRGTTRPPGSGGS